jgi:hypothetical protein
MNSRIVNLCAGMSLVLLVGTSAISLAMLRRGTHQFGVGKVAFATSIHTYDDGLTVDWYSHILVFRASDAQVDFRYYSSPKAISAGGWFSGSLKQLAAQQAKIRQHEYRALGFGWDSQGALPSSGWPHIIVPDWFIAATIMLLGLPLLLHRYKTRSLRQAGFCSQCGYDLRATPDRCPECGTVPRKAQLALH